MKPLDATRKEAFGLLRFLGGQFFVFILILCDQGIKLLKVPERDFQSYSVTLNSTSIELLLLILSLASIGWQHVTS